MCVLAVPTEGASKTSEGRGTQELLRDFGPNIITEQEYSFTATAESETLRDVKEKLRFIGLDCDTGLANESQTETSSFSSVARKRCSSQSHWPPASTTLFS